MAKIEAPVSLDVECPECGHYFDITHKDDLWHGIEAAETREVYKTSCPKCKHDIQVRLGLLIRPKSRLV